jgi:hypothetical protein
MLIECPFCHAKANLPDSKEGAKVRCPECGKVYVARDRSRRGGSRGPNPLHLGLAAGVVLVLLVVIFAVNRSGADEGAPAAAQATGPVEPPPEVDLTGWDSAPVQAARAVYAAAASYNEGRLRSLLHGPRLLERLRADGAEDLPEGGWSTLAAADREALLVRTAEGLLEGEGDTVAALWKPYDGSVVSETDDTAVVHVLVAGREGELAAQSRTIEWKLAREGTAWKAWAWERYIPPEERLADGARRNREITRVELDDGTRLFQADPRPLPHLDDTPGEVRERIDDAARRLIDFSLRPRENNAAASELVEIGKPSIPILLTAMYETKITDDTTLAKVTKIHHTLRDITGYDPGFPVNALGPDSEQKREMAVKAWFAWWLRKGEKRFEERQLGPDLLDELIEPTEKDLREMRRSGGG